MGANLPLLASAGFVAAVVVALVDGANAVTYASLAAALGLAPSVATLYGPDAALLLIGAGAAATVAGPVARAIATRVNVTAGIDPTVPVAAGSEGLFGPRSIRVAVAILVLPAASWLSYNVPVGSASPVTGILFPAALVWGCGAMRVLAARTIGDIAVGVAVVGIASAAAWFLAPGVDTVPSAAGAVALAPVAAAVAGWLRGRRAAALAGADGAPA